MTAIEKIDKELKGAKLSPKGKAVGNSVVNVLKTFCSQNDEFAQAIVQSSNTVDKCIEYTVKDAGSSISDIEVYRRAVEFYFKGATVKFEMVLDLGDGGFSNKPIPAEEALAENKAQSKPPIRLSLDDIFD